MKGRATVAAEIFGSDSSEYEFISAVWLQAGPSGRRLLPALGAVGARGARDGERHLGLNAASWVSQPYSWLE